MNVIADINIVCIEQRKKELFIDDLVNIVCKKNPYTFYTEWEILSNLRGYWYQISPKKRDYGVYDNEFFGLHTKKNKCFVSIDDERYSVEFVKKIIEFYLNKSNIHKICFLIRLNYQTKNKIIGVIRYKDFIKKLENKKIFFDTAYIIEL